MERENKNLHTTKPAADFAGTRKFDPEKLLSSQPNPLPPQQEVDPGPMGIAKVCRGRTVHVPTGQKIVIGSRPYELNGAILHRDVTTQAYRSAGPGEIVELPQTEIDRLTELGFLQPIDDQPAKGLKVKPVRPETGVKDDVRLRGVNSLTTAK